MTNPLEYKEIRQGFSALAKANTHLYSSEGKLCNQDIVDALLEPDSAKLYAFFRSLPLFGGPHYNPSQMTHLIADAAKVERLPQRVYLEGMQNEAARITKKIDANYSDMPKDERLKLASFLYRPESQRILTFEERWYILFSPAIIDRPTDPNAPAPPSETGLRKVLITLLESDSFDFPNNDELHNLWKQEGWLSYIELGQSFTRASFKDGNFQAVYLPQNVSTDNPQQTEGLMIDAINHAREYCDGVTSFDLDKIAKITFKILSNRHILQGHQYFMDENNESDRHSMLDDLLNGRTIWR